MAWDVFIIRSFSYLKFKVFNEFPTSCINIIQLASGKDAVTLIQWSSVLAAHLERLKKIEISRPHATSQTNYIKTSGEGQADIRIFNGLSVSPASGKVCDCGSSDTDLGFPFVTHFSFHWWLCRIAKVHSSFHTLHGLFYFKVMLPAILYVHALFFHKLLNLLLLFSFQIRSLLYLELFTFSLLLCFWSAGELKFTKYITPTLNREKMQKPKIEWRK